MADVVNEIISHCAATVCIHPPTLLTNCALHMAAKACEWNGAHAEPFGAGSAVPWPWSARSDAFGATDASGGSSGSVDAT